MWRQWPVFPAACHTKSFGNVIVAQAKGNITSVFSFNVFLFCGCTPLFFSVFFFFLFFLLLWLNRIGFVLFLRSFCAVVGGGGAGVCTHHYIMDTVGGSSQKKRQPHAKTERSEGKRERERDNLRTKDCGGRKEGKPPHDAAPTLPAVCPPAVRHDTEQARFGYGP